MRICMLGGAYERFLNLCANHQILLWDICPAKKGYEANLYARDFFRLKPLAGKCRTRVRIRKKCGLPFFMYHHRKRKVFVLGLCLCGFFIFYLSCFVWKIETEGNLSVSRQTMMAYLGQHDISYGTRKSEVDCKQLAADLRSAFPDFTWVAVKLQGTCLSIQVRENHDRTEEIPVYGDSDLVADEDGTIVSMITRAGAPLVGEGDTISKGDLLVKGELAITDDSGNVAAYRYCAADADIYIRTTITYSDTFLLAHEEEEYTGRKRYGLYLALSGRYLGIDMGVHSFVLSDVLGEEHQLRVLDDFYLPVQFGILEAREYKKTVKIYSEKEAMQIADAKLQKFLLENEQKGVQIFENNVRINISATSCHAEGTLTVVKKTGRRVDAQKSDLPQEGTDE